MNIKSGWRLGGGSRRAKVIVGVAGVLWLATLGYWIKPLFDGGSASHGRPGTSVTVKIAAGSSAGQIADALRKAGVVSSGGDFTDAVEGAGRTRSLQPGVYRLKRGMSASAALKALLDPASRISLKVTLPEGLRLDETLPLIARRTGLPLADLRQAAADPAALGLPGYLNGDLEGALYPDTYLFDPGTTARQALTAMVGEFRDTAARLRLDQAPGGPRAALITASLAQAEGGGPADYPKITRVIANRIARHRPLQLDTTVLYAQRRHSLHVTEQDTRITSPYNTYLRPGLPAGPIDNPGSAALQAAVHPAQGRWLWFVTTDPMHKVTQFTDSESRFERLKAQLAANMRGH